MTITDRLRHSVDYNRALVCYASYCGIPVDYLVETFHVLPTGNGVLLPYLSLSGEPIRNQGAGLPRTHRCRLLNADGKVGSHRWPPGTRSPKDLLYGMWQLGSAYRGVVLVEGETSVIAGNWATRRTGVAWLGTPGNSPGTGSMHWWTLTDHLTENPDLRVWLWPDYDQPGVKWLELVQDWASQHHLTGRITLLSHKLDARDFYLLYPDTEWPPADTALWPPPGTEKPAPLPPIISRPPPVVPHRKPVLPRWEYSRADIERAKERVDLHDCLVRMGAVRKRERSYQCYNPSAHAHGDRTPSLSVIPSGAGYLCFGCGESGDRLTAYQTAHHLEFRDAMVALLGDPTPPQ